MNRIVALTFLGIVVAAIAVIVLGQTPRFYPGSTAVTRLTTQYDVRPDGDLDVTETIIYDYGASGLPLDRVVQLRRPDADRLDTPVPDRGRDRVWEVSGAVLLLVLVGLVARRITRSRQRSSAARA
ncbi:hypothetical protein EV652_101662 [Kribbella steppae]|uniref:Uncharacterized protein n=1 Tax=Kribbella steppae TaxID=2512223 RepID=A0A4R2HWU6_9ACTN|nr:hypothetical protein [Kribbella steppae]TCO35777.1 hypothetical protein EV652_101662 [Kribbella steppae]